MYKRKQLCILVIWGLMLGCGKKDQPIEIEADSISVSVIDKPLAVESSQLAPENSMEYLSIELDQKPLKASVLGEPKVGPQVKLIFKRPQFSRREERIEYVDQNLSMLKFLKCTITGIEGLEQLKSLDTIILDRVSSLDNLFFLSEILNLKRLFIEYITENIDWGFVEQLPNLQVLYVESYFQPTISINLINNKNLEYLGFSSGVLEAFPSIYNVPVSLKYINLEGNKISSLPSSIDMLTQLLTVHIIWELKDISHS